MTHSTTTGNTWTHEISGSGEFVRGQSEFRDWIRQDKSTNFVPEQNRYHLYVSYACPWAHRTLITRALLGLQDVLSVDVVHPFLDDRGWHFEDSDAYGPSRDSLHHEPLLKQLYDRAAPGNNYPGRITVPVLWDRHNDTIVNNESSEIIRMLAKEFAELGTQRIDLYPDDLARRIDELNEWIYASVNNGVYRCGFATTQSAYEAAFVELFDALDRLEAILDKQRYLTGERFTEADVRLFPTLVRFDPVYHNHFRCNLRKISEYPNLANYVLDVAQMPGIAETIHMNHIKDHYYKSHTSINPTQIVPVGPKTDLTAPHNRNRSYHNKENSHDAH